jgi:hypothetical protein
MIHKFEDFTLEQELNHWIHLYESVNESNSFSLKERIVNFIESLIEKGEDLGPILKKIFKFFTFKKAIIILVISILINYFGFQRHDIIQHTTPQTKDLVEQASDQSTQLQKKEVDQIDDYLQALTDKESSDDPTQINKFGYIGKYQFGKTALKELELDKKINTRKFRKNP